MVGHHHHVDPESGDAKVLWAVGVNLALTIVQLIGGIWAGSLALVADAIHNLSDAVSLGIAFAARKIARRPADAGMTFGYGRAEIVAALVNYSTLIIIGVYLVYEAILRLLNPADVDGWLVVVIAVVALVVDLVTAMLTFALSKNSMNIRAAFLHNVADALGSVAVIVAGTLIILYDWRLVDPLITLLIAGYILWTSFAEIGPVIRILMLGSPDDMDTGKVMADIGTVIGVNSVHHLHLWQMQEHAVALEAHIVIDQARWAEVDRIKSAIKELLKSGHDIEHITLELEGSDNICDQTQVIGHS